MGLFIRFWHLPFPLYLIFATQLPLLLFYPKLPSTDNQLVIFYYAPQSISYLIMFFSFFVIDKFINQFRWIYFIFYTIIMTSFYTIVNLFYQNGTVSPRKITKNLESKTYEKNKERQTCFQEFWWFFYQQLAENQRFYCSFGIMQCITSMLLDNNSSLLIMNS